MRNKYRGRGGTKAAWHFLSIIIQAKALISGVSLLSLPLASAPWLASRQVHILWSSNHLRGQRAGGPVSACACLALKGELSAHRQGSRW